MKYQQTSRGSSSPSSQRQGRARPQQRRPLL